MTYDLPYPLERSRAARVYRNKPDKVLSGIRANDWIDAPADPPVTLVLLDAIAFWRDLEGMEP